MRLDFRILWFENQPQDVAAQIREVEDYIREVGFIPYIELKVDASQLDALSLQQQRYDDFDLVVVDYDLGSPEENGDYVAGMIRRSFGFTDIIFYSGKVPNELRKMVCERGIDGVYCAARNNLVERLEAHIEQVVTRMSRLGAMRGLAMSAVGKCDDVLRETLQSIHDSSVPARQAEVVAELNKYVDEGVAVALRKYDKCSTLTARLESRAVTSFHLQKLALAALKGNTECTTQRKLLCSYNDEVLTPRNTLGHAVEIRGELGWEIMSHGNPAITAADFARLRKSLICHLANLSKIKSLLD